MKVLIIVTLALFAFALFGIALALLWVAYYVLAHARDRRRHCAPPKCPCGCGRPIRDVPALPRDGRPLDDYEKRHLASVLLGYMASPDDESSERENQL